MSFTSLFIMEAEHETRFILPLGSDELTDFAFPLKVIWKSGRFSTAEMQHEVSSRGTGWPNILVSVLQTLLLQYRPGGQQTLGADTVPLLLSPST